MTAIATIGSFVLFVLINHRQDLNTTLKEFKTDVFKLHSDPSCSKYTSHIDALKNLQDLIQTYKKELEIIDHSISSIRK